MKIGRRVDVFVERDKLLAGDIYRSMYSEAIGVNPCDRFRHTFDDTG